MAKPIRSRLLLLVLFSVGALVNSALTIIWVDDSAPRWVRAIDYNFIIGLYAWPVLTVAALAFTARAIWRAGGWTRIVGLGFAAVALACCVGAMLHFRANPLLVPPF